MSSTSTSGHGQRQLTATRFGDRLRHWRKVRRRTQAQLAKSLDVDGSYVSKLESGRRSPTAGIAIRCDELLDTDGELTALLQERPPRLEPAVPIPALWEPPAVPNDFQRPSGHANPHTVVTLTRLLEAYVDIDSTMGGRQIGTSVEQQAQDLIRMQIAAPFPVRRTLLVLAAKFARLAGWIRFDNGDRDGSLFWHDCAQRWANAGGDQDLAVELLARQSRVHSAMGDHEGAMRVAESTPVAESGVSPTGTTWAFIARARAHGAAGETARAIDYMSEAATSFARVSGSLQAAPAACGNDFLWHTFLGKCRLDLATAASDPTEYGHEAVVALSTAIDSLPAHQVRDRALAHLRLCHAYWLAGDSDQAADQLDSAGELVQRCSSARAHSVMVSLRKLTDPSGPSAATDQSGVIRKL